MAEQAVILALGLDPSGVKTGAAEATKALDNVKEAAEEAAGGVALVNAEVEAAGDSAGSFSDAIDQAKTATEDFGAQAKNTAAVVDRDLNRGLKETANRTTETSNKVSFMDTVLEKAKDKFANLGKAAVGMFAADIAARVLGFSSAMDVLNKASQAVADAIVNVGKAVAGMGDEYERSVRAAERLRELTAQAKLEEEGKSLTTVYGDPSGRGVTPSFATSFTPFLGDSGELNAAVLAYDKVISKIKTLEQEYSNLASSQFQTGLLIRGPEIKNEIRGLVDSVSGAISDAVAEVRRLAEADKKRAEEARTAAQTAAKEAEQAEQRSKELQSKLFLTRATQKYSGEFSAPFTTEKLPAGVGPSAAGPVAAATEKFGQALLFSRTSTFDEFLAATIEDTRRELEGQEYAGFVENAANWASLAQEAWSKEMESMQKAVSDAIESEYEYERRSESEAELARIAERARRGEYGLDRNIPGDKGLQFSQQVSGGLSSALETAVYSGEWDRFGRSVVNVISQSLVNALVTKPFEQAMQALINSMLAGLTRAVSVPSVVPATGTTDPAPLMSPRSNLPSRSQRQVYDDLNRRRL